MAQKQISGLDLGAVEEAVKQHVFKYGCIIPDVLNRKLGVKLQEK